ncbi:hypothetical protein BO82DRAFT_351787 [Aspergillus uvarum CBS 121591]|uniref:Uncharacterized protein n=1 Tax=Aspergillus uvarum CBS 121591 TaxID=1448315 RepID=A0A319CNJ8_9EURO|nr:hypothetical protein BO82DRAFT_351787 [Aspergillus uvarum CBS 121591]PYH84577.1 hypothetical protein BO82DRAFT_351787 [Aspergillus uvarum CBS 121591]
MGPKTTHPHNFYGRTFAQRVHPKTPLFLTDGVCPSSSLEHTRPAERSTLCR